LRLPSNLLSSVADVSREMTVGPSSGFEREDADRERERINSARYPFAKSAQLLRRFGSHEGLNELDDDDDEDRQTDDDFSSEVSRLKYSFNLEMTRRLTDDCIITGRVI
jgi:hypothetical protein